ncbi:MAG: hypothetical protein ACI8RD_010734, partial [Bacillariaceae sp.]
HHSHDWGLYQYLIYMIVELTYIFFSLLYLSLDAIVHVVRCFEDEDVIHVDGTGKF